MHSINLNELSSVTPEYVSKFVDIHSDTWENTTHSQVYDIVFIKKIAVIWMKELESLVKDNLFDTVNLQNIQHKLLSKFSASIDILNESAKIVGSCWLYQGNTNYANYFSQWRKEQ